MTSDASGYLSGQLLIAMPHMQDRRFERSVIYICAHTEEAAMGLMVNRLMDSISFPDLLIQLGIPSNPDSEEIRVHFGGPVESAKGFVLHSADYVGDGTMVVTEDIALTATVDILKAIADGEGPKSSLLALGYAGWGPGQLDSEIQANGWLIAPSDEKLIFDGDLDSKWERAMAKLGVDFAKLSVEAGHA